MRTSKPHHKEYMVWIAMNQRVHDQNHSTYFYLNTKRNKPIKVCKEWLFDFERFYADMGPKPHPLARLRRRDPNGDFTPENCYWFVSDQNWRKRDYRLKHYTKSPRFIAASEN